MEGEEGAAGVVGCEGDLGAVLEGVEGTGSD